MPLCPRCEVSLIGEAQSLGQLSRPLRRCLKQQRSTGPVLCKGEGDKDVTEVLWKPPGWSAALEDPKQMPHMAWQWLSGSVASPASPRGRSQTKTSR